MQALLHTTVAACMLSDGGTGIRVQGAGCRDGSDCGLFVEPWGESFWHGLLSCCCQDVTGWKPRR